MIAAATILLDVSGSLAIIVVLTLVYGQVQRMHFTLQRGQMLLGIAFGGVAWLQMHLPFDPTKTLAVDLRNIPLVLCGAFLGWRASLLCLAIAGLTRIAIGGIGVAPGLLGLIIAVSVGGAWAFATRNIAKRGLSHMLLLSILGSLHLAAGLAIPEPARSWFFSNAALPIAMLNLVTITLTAWLLDAEQRKILSETRLEAAVAVHPDHGALTKPSFEREILLRVTAGKMLPPAALLVIKLRYADALFSVIPKAWRNKVLGLVRLRLKDAFANSDLICSLDGTVLLIPLDEDQLADKGALSAEIVRLIGSEPFQFSDTIRKAVTVDTHIQAWPADKSFEEILTLVRFSLMPKRKDRFFWCAPRKSSEEGKLHNAIGASTHGAFVSHSTTETLFNKAAFLMKPKRRLTPK